MSKKIYEVEVVTQVTKWVEVEAESESAAAELGLRYVYGEYYVGYLTGEETHTAEVVHVVEEFDQSPLEGDDDDRDDIF